MKTPRNKYYLLNYIFLFCLLILVTNDHYLKYEYGNWFTGKLSDMVGIIMLPLLITWLFPAVKERSIVISAVLFTCWKSPFSQGVIDLYNQFAFIQTSRVVDYTDLLVLALLSIPWLLIKRIDFLHNIKITGVNPILMLVPTVISLMATTPPRQIRPHTRSDGNLTCYSCKFTVHYNQPEIIEMFKKVDIVLDTCLDYTPREGEPQDFWLSHNIHFYLLNQLIIDKDTLRDIEFNMNTYEDKRTRITISRMIVPDSIITPDLQKKVERYYKNLLLKLLMPNFKG